MFNVIATGSTGNAIIYNKNILVDCGVPYASLKDFKNDLQIVLLTHEHQDHINLQSLKKLQFERPSLRIGCCDWMTSLISGLKNIDVYQIGKVYDYGSFKISPIQLYHDVKNCGYRIFIQQTDSIYKIFHATDTAHLQGIEAKNYDLYSIEHNYDEDTVFDLIQQKEANGEFAHQKSAMNGHLSEQAARNFIFQNRGEHCEVVRLHESKIVKLK